MKKINCKIIINAEVLDYNETLDLALLKLNNCSLIQKLLMYGIILLYLTKYDKVNKAIKKKNIVDKRSFLTVTLERLERSANGLKDHCCVVKKT
jgi:hypothetical protein